MKFMNKKYGEGRVRVEIKDQYFNMRKMVEPVYHIVERAEKAMVDAGVKPIVKPIRGVQTEPTFLSKDYLVPTSLPEDTISTGNMSLFL